LPLRRRSSPLSCPPVAATTVKNFYCSHELVQRISKFRSGGYGQAALYCNVGNALYARQDRLLLVLTA
jgi:hypothetical protein